MATSHKAKSIEEAKDKVRARSAAATEVVDGSKELGNQIMRLMAALSRSEQAITLLVLHTVPGTGVVGEGIWIGILLPAQLP